MKRTVKKIIYTAGVVTDKSELSKIISEGYPNIFCDHMTIKFGDINEMPEYIGKKFNFVVEFIAFNEKAVAVAGYPDNEEIKNFMKSIDQIPHITICTAKDIKPVYSNELIKVGFRESMNLIILMKVGAFVAYDDNSTGWKYSKRNMK